MIQQQGQLERRSYRLTSRPSPRDFDAGIKGDFLTRLSIAPHEELFAVEISGAGASTVVDNSHTLYDIGPSVICFCFVRGQQED